VSEWDRTVDEGPIADLLLEVEQLRKREAHYARVARENENLAYLYVASDRLHSTLDPDPLGEIVREIVIELVGAEEFGLVLADEQTLVPVLVEGPDHAYSALAASEGLVGTAMRSGKVQYDLLPSAGAPMAAVPLRVDGRAVGAIVILKMLHGKTSFDPMARELLALLSRHAATALIAARLYSAANRSFSGPAK
jgi:hypothetical protein